MTELIKGKVKTVYSIDSEPEKVLIKFEDALEIGRASCRERV